MATTFYLTDADSDVSGYKLAVLGARSGCPSLVQAATNTAAGPSTAQIIRSAGGATLQWITEPLAAYTPSVAAWTAHVWAKESNAAANVGLRVRVVKWSAGAEGADILYDTVTGELGTTTADINRTTVNATATALAAGDRLVFKVYLADVGTQAAGYTATVSYNGENPFAEGDSNIVSPDTVAVLAALPTTTTLQVRQAILDMGTDASYTNAQLTAAQVTQAFNEALREYSRDRPRIVADTFSGDGVTFDFPLPRRWIHQFSVALEVEFPAGNQVKTLVDRNEWEVLESTLNYQPVRVLRLITVTPSGSESVVVRYTTHHQHDDRLSTVPADHLDAVCALAGSIALTSIAAKMAGASDPTIAADAVDFRESESKLLDAARALRKRYLQLLADDDSAAPTGDQQRYDVNYSWRSRFLFHGERRGF